MKKNKNIDLRQRVVFMKMKNKITNKDNYKFLGLFGFYEKIDNGVTYKTIYRRIQREFKIIK